MYSSMFIKRHVIYYGKRLVIYWLAFSPLPSIFGNWKIKANLKDKKKYIPTLFHLKTYEKHNKHLNKSILILKLTFNRLKSEKAIQIQNYPRVLIYLFLAG